MGYLWDSGHLFLVCVEHEKVAEAFKYCTHLKSCTSEMSNISGDMIAEIEEMALLSEQRYVKLEKIKKLCPSTSRLIPVQSASSARSKSAWYEGHGARILVRYKRWPIELQMSA